MSLFAGGPQISKSVEGAVLFAVAATLAAGGDTRAFKELSKDKDDDESSRKIFYPEDVEGWNKLIGRITQGAKAQGRASGARADSRGAGGGAATATPSRPDSGGIGNGGEGGGSSGAGGGAGIGGGRGSSGAGGGVRSSGGRGSSGAAGGAGSGGGSGGAGGMRAANGDEDESTTQLLLDLEAALAAAQAAEQLAKPPVSRAAAYLPVCSGGAALATAAPPFGQFGASSGGYTRAFPLAHALQQQPAGAPAGAPGAAAAARNSGAVLAPAAPLSGQFALGSGGLIWAFLLAHALQQQPAGAPAGAPPGAAAAAHISGAVLAPGAPPSGQFGLGSGGHEFNPAIWPAALQGIISQEAQRTALRRSTGT